MVYTMWCYSSTRRLVASDNWFVMYWTNLLAVTRFFDTGAGLNVIIGNSLPTDWKESATYINSQQLETKIKRSWTLRASCNCSYVLFTDTYAQGLGLLNILLLTYGLEQGLSTSKFAGYFQYSEISSIGIRGQCKLLQQRLQFIR